MLGTADAQPGSLNFSLPPPLKPPLPHAVAHDRRETADQRRDQNRPEAAAEAVFADRGPDPGREQRAEPGQP